jgi:hypothetical protein
VPLLERLQQLDDLELDCTVQGRRGFIQHKQARPRADGGTPGIWPVEAEAGWAAWDHPVGGTGTDGDYGRLRNSPAARRTSP